MQRQQLHRTRPTAHLHEVQFQQRVRPRSAFAPLPTHLRIRQVARDVERRSRQPRFRRQRHRQVHRVQRQRLVREHLIARRHVFVVARHPGQRDFDPLLRPDVADIQGPGAADVKIRLRLVLQRQLQILVHQRLACHLDRAPLPRNHILRKLWISRQELTRKRRALRRLNLNRHRVRALPCVRTGQQLVLAVRLLNRQRVKPSRRLHGRPVLRKNHQPPRRTHPRRLDLQPPPVHRRLTLDLRPEIINAPRRENQNPRVDRPHPEVHHPQRNPTHRHHENVDADQRHQHIERPPVKPLELRHFKKTLLTELGHRAADRAVNEQQDHQENTQPDVAEQGDQRVPATTPARRGPCVLPLIRPAPRINRRR